MTTIIFSNKLEKVEKILNQPRCPTKYLILQNSKETSEIETFLQGKMNCQEIDSSEFFRKKQDAFWEEYINLLGRINRNNHSLFWWGLDFTNKNPITSNLCNRIAHLLYLKDLISHKPSGNLLIITDDTILMRQVKILVRIEKIKIINAIEIKLSIKRILKKFTPFVILRTFLKKILLRSYAKKYCQFSADKNKKYIVVMSLLNHQSFDKNGHYYDTYFGKFVDYLREKNIPFFIFALIIYPSNYTILKKVKLQRPSLPLVAMENYLPFSKLVNCFFYSLIKFFSPIRVKGEIKIEGMDVTYLVKRAIRDSYVSNGFFSNLCVYYCTKSLAEQINIKKFFYPFENRSFEKMMLLALKKVPKKIETAGYQHASISLRHTNFFLSENESKVIPLPDSIITMGEITKEILENACNFPGKILRVGCALRQNLRRDITKKRGEKISNILVVLATGLEEYAKTLDFLDKTFKDDNSHNISIRPHPIFSLKEGIRLAPPLRFKFSSGEGIPLNKSLEWSDLVIYVHSTIVLEAFSWGIPAIYLNLGDPLNPDPLFNFSHFKWTVNNSKKLLDTIHYIETIHEEKFQNLQREAKKYSERYIYPVTEENLSHFLH